MLKWEFGFQIIGITYSLAVELQGDNQQWLYYHEVSFIHKEKIAEIRRNVENVVSVSSKI